ncbi:SCO6745 family protein [Saccharomonospora azurea]|uniref:SCO6745 family protein n=1 Tax=Saccharomonospora azurea TaxID=40988 RepID=UPI00023FEAA9|nr:hypothetical protein [Saccharomonospora azurea]EHK84473.1 hypothetical protein SZMC14600_17914 [Saccharomonospora azurea SZMC 14600]
MDRALARELAHRCHNAVEPLHAFVYFSPEMEQTFAGAGLKAGRRAYFAGRAAPLGPVGATVVTATFYNFSPRLVERHIPEAWRVVAPAEVVNLRFSAAEAGLRRLLGEAADSPEVGELGELLREAAGHAPAEGRALFAAHADLDWPDGAVARLWHAATLLREFRGDGHIAALVAEGLSGLDALVTHIATGKSFRADVARETRGWTEAEWSAAEDALRERGLLDDTGALTDAGHALRAAVEERTDAAATAPYRKLGEDKARRIVELAKPLSRTLLKAGGIPRELFARG